MLPNSRVFFFLCLPFAIFSLIVILRSNRREPKPKPKICLHRNVSLENLPLSFVQTGIFVPTGLKIVAFSTCTKKWPIFALIDNRTIPGKRKTYVGGCKWGPNPVCQVEGGVLEFELKSKPQRPQIRLAHEQKALESAPAIPILSLPIKEQLDPLTVCVPALFMLDDWVQLVQFLEMWIQLGATKIFLYVQSVSTEVQRVLELYKDTVERVPWPLLPAYASFSADTINNNVYYAGQVASANDCLLRNQRQAQFTAFVDLDELLVPMSPQVHPEALAQFLQNLSQSYPDAGAFKFRASHVHVQKNFSEDFSHLLEVKREQHVWPPESLTKIVLRPDRVEEINFHDVSKLQGRYKTHTVSPNLGLLYHIRRVRDKLKPIRKEVILDRSLAQLASSAAAVWIQRRQAVPDLKSPSTTLIPFMEECILRLYAKRQKECYSTNVCCQEALARDPTGWVETKGQWTTVPPPGDQVHYCQN